MPSYTELARLARDDPQAFENLRSALIENTILRAPERLQLRLRQLQFRVDGIRRLARTPLGALIKMQAMMWESFLHLDDALHRIERLQRNASGHPGNARMPDGNAHVAQIVDFRTRLPLGG